MKKLFILFAGFIMVANSFATTFYIDPLGNDGTGTGAIGNPWATLKKATTVVTTSGDIIHVNAGTYTETLQSTLSVGVSIEGAGVTSIIRASFSTANTAILVAASAEGTNGNQHISNCLFEGQLSTTWGIEIKGRSNFSIHDCTIQNFAQRGIMWSGRNDNSAAPPSIYATGNTFYNNILQNCATYTGGTGFGGLMIGGQDGMLVYNSTLTQLGRASGTNGWPIKYANDGYLKGCKIYNCTVTKEPFDGTTWDFAFELFNVSGLEIYGNTIQGSIDLNYQPKLTYAYSVYIHDNVIGYSTPQTQIERGVVLEFDCETIWIKNNHFKNLYNPIYYSTRNNTQITNNVISNNLMESTGNTSGGAGFGIRFISDGSANYTLSNFTIDHNTIVGNYYQGISLVDGGAISGVSITNNIIDDYAHSFLFGDPSSVITTIAWFNNNFYNTGTWGTSPRWVGGTPSAETSGSNLNLNPTFTGAYVPTNSTILTGANDGTAIGYTGGTPIPPPVVYPTFFLGRIKIN